MKAPEGEVFDDPQDHHPDEGRERAVDGLLRRGDQHVETQRQRHHEREQQDGEQHAEHHKS
jgi:hypothetical protein